MQNQEDKGSLEDKGWDILAGGQKHAREAGGEDPFDIEATAASSAEENPFAEKGKVGAAADSPFDEPVGASLTAGGENPFDRDETGEVLDSGHGTARPSAPAEAYGDWGRGGDRPDLSAPPGETAEPEPRDLKPEEVDSVLHQVEEKKEKIKPKVTFEPGETVKITDGPFLNFSGVLEEVDPNRGKLKVSVAIFGRSAPVELEYWQVERA